MKASPAVAWISLLTIVRREVRRFLRIWMQTLIPPMITTFLYFIIFGTLIGPRIGTMGGHPYMEFIAPGLIMMAVITNSYSNVVSTFYSARYQRFIDEMLVSPTPNYIIVLGYVTGGVARGLTVGVLVTMVATAFTDLSVVHPLITLIFVLLTAALFSLGGFINAIYANSFDDITIIPSFVLTPLTYLGGVFYSIEMLSDTWRGVSQLNPILYMVNGFRYGILGSSDINVWLALGIITVFIALLFSFSINLLNRGVGIRT